VSEITFESLLNEKCFQRLMDAVIEHALDVTRETGLSINQLHWEFFDETTEYTPDGCIVGVKARLVPNPPEVVE